MFIRRAALWALLLLPAASAAQAAVIATYTDRSVFLAQVPVSATVSLGSGGAAPNISFSGPAASATAGPLTISASPGNLYGDGNAVSTEIEQMTLTLHFAQPVLAAGLFPYITNEDFTAFAGQLQIALAGSGTEVFNVSSTGPAFIGYESDTAFSSLQISILSFDMSGTATAFATIATSVDIGAANISIPGPGFAALAPALFSLLWNRRRRDGHTQGRNPA